ncbi:11428_t:CDS:2, partial [Diversispora eburnea]
FGMLLWELVFEKIPYEKWNTLKVKEHVLAGKREKITLKKAPPDVEKLQIGLAKIIISAWQEDPEIRASLQNIFVNLDHLIDEYCTPNKEFSDPILSDKELDLDAVSISDEGGSDLPDMDFDIHEISQIIPLEEGIAAHRKGEHAKAWECFLAYADLNNALAKYWKGYYLWEGIVVEKDREQATRLFKEAAYDEIVDEELEKPVINNAVFGDILNNFQFSELVDNINKFSSEDIFKTDFFSVKATIMLGTTATTNLENLLLDQKDTIYNILESQPVYAVGPNFKQGYLIPCITCYVSKPLESQVLAKLSELFDHNYEIVEQMVEPMDEDTSGDEFLKVSSTARVRHKNDFQTFNIKVYLWANVGCDKKFSKSSENTLEFIVNLHSCGIGPMLNKQCHLPNFVGYYLDSVSINVSPIPSIPDYASISIEDEYRPQKHTSIEQSVGSEKTRGLNLSAGQSPGAIASYIDKNIESFRSTTDYWRMKCNRCPVKGVSWEYFCSAQELDKDFENRQNLPSFGDNCGDWKFESSVKGFSVTIQQVLNCINKSTFNFLKNFRNNKPPVMKCPKMVHTLEITFNDLKEFNENFGELRKIYYYGSETPELELGNKNLKSDFLENKYVNSSINRELKLKTNKKLDK